jgi:hypothetical protein
MEEVAMTTEARGMAFPTAIAALTLLTGACGEPHPTSPTASPPNGASFTQATLPPFPGADQFVAVIDNPYYPLIPGTTFEYRAETDEGVETNTVEVTSQTKTILGVAATVVHDQVFLGGELTEDTFDWYAQDVRGNIWYLGEQSCEVENGQCVSTGGSWEAGVDGALPGVIMWADPAAHKGDTYQQEFLAGTAEDVAKVIGLDAKVDTPYGSFIGCLETMDWSPLETASREHKFYCPGTGLVLEVAPSSGHERSELVGIVK